jgi:hypothetical protein
MFEALDTAIRDIHGAADKGESVKITLKAADESVGPGGVYAAGVADRLKKIAGANGSEEAVLDAILKHSATLAVDPGKDLGKATDNIIFVANHAAAGSANDIKAAAQWKEIEQKPDYLTRAGALRLSLETAQATPPSSALHKLAVETAQGYAAQNDVIGKLDSDERQRATQYLELTATASGQNGQASVVRRGIVPNTQGYSERAQNGPENAEAVYTGATR